MSHREEIGALLADLRHKKELSLRELAALTGLDHSNLAKIEKGRYNVSVDLLYKVCDALGAKIKIEV